MESYLVFGMRNEECVIKCGALWTEAGHVVHFGEVGVANKNICYITDT